MVSMTTKFLSVNDLEEDALTRLDVLLARKVRRYFWVGGVLLAASAVAFLLAFVLSFNPGVGAIFVVMAIVSIFLGGFAIWDQKLVRGGRVVYGEIVDVGSVSKGGLVAVEIMLDPDENGRDGRIVRCDYPGDMVVGRRSRVVPVVLGQNEEKVMPLVMYIGERDVDVYMECLVGLLGEESEKTAGPLVVLPGSEKGHFERP